MGEVVEFKSGHRCGVCSGEGFVCENHMTRPWLPEPEGCMCGASAPCPYCKGGDTPRPTRPETIEFTAPAVTPEEAIEALQDLAEARQDVINAVRDAIDELFGPIALMETEETTLGRRGPEPKHDFEAILEALQRVKAALDREP